MHARCCPSPARPPAATLTHPHPHPFCARPAVAPGRLNPIFALQSDDVTTLRDYGGSCKSQFSSSTFNSADKMKEDISAR